MNPQHPHYEDPDPCTSCRGDVYPVKDTYLGPICSDCRQLCASCGDWLMGDSVKVDGERHHGACAEELMHGRLLAQLAESVRLEAVNG